MGRRRKSPSMTDGKREIISRLIEEYDIKTAEDIQDALRDLLGGTIDVYKRQTQGFSLRQ